LKFTLIVLVNEVRYVQVRILVPGKRLTPIAPTDLFRVLRKTSNKFLVNSSEMKYIQKATYPMLEKNQPYLAIIIHSYTPP